MDFKSLYFNAAMLFISAYIDDEDYVSILWNLILVSFKLFVNSGYNPTNPQVILVSCNYTSFFFWEQNLNSVRYSIVSFQGPKWPNNHKIITI